MSRLRVLLLSGTTVLGLGLTLTGCGVIFGFGVDQPIQVASNPEVASIEVDGIPLKDAVTPTTIHVHPKADHHISVKLEGYKNASRTVTKELRTDIVILDAVLTLGIGLLVDYLSGALYRLDEKVTLNLGKVGDVTTTKNGGKPDPDPDPKGPKPDPDADPCTICGEPRGDISPCPHCGIE